jgi:hypothetical protein
MTGLAGSGKDTVADRLVEEFGFQKIAFADELKRVLLVTNPIIGNDHFTLRPIYLQDAVEQYGEPAVKLVYPEYRRLLQRLGTEGVRAIDDRFWIKAALKKVTDQSSNYVFTDVRFPNEAKAIRELGGFLCYVSRPQLDSPVLAHESEIAAGLLWEELAIGNDGTMQQLHDKADDMMFQLLSEVAA